MAEREGFEPSIPFGIHAFQACAFDRSAISPKTDTQTTRLFATAHMAEEEGFEPPVPFGTTVFKTAAFNRSATPPRKSEG